jgi:short-subunit dehydrogenase
MPTSSTEPGSESAATPVAVVTGASRGLGFLLACELADRGHNLVVNARSADGLAAAATDLRSRGVQVDEVAGDVSDPEVAARLVTAATGRFGRLDVLVANAGVIQVGPVQAMRPEDFAEAMDVMYWGVVRPTLAAMPALRAHHGRVLVVTSIGGKLPAPHLLPYVAAKHAAVGFAEGLRIEAARDGVSVTVGVPGLMRTGSPRNALFTGDQAAEHAWFAVGDSLPVLSMNAERAASRLVRATLRGTPEVILTPAAWLGARLHGLAPATTLRLLTIANQLLPADRTSTPTRPGHAVAGTGSVLRTLTTLTRKAAERTHELTDPTPDRLPADTR